MARLMLNPPVMMLLGFVLAVIVGLSLGLLGGGGSILTLPLLVYVLELPAHEAVAGSLAVVGATSLVAMLLHARAGRVRWRVGLVVGAAGMVGSVGGARLAAFIPGPVLLTLFAIVMLTTAVAMLRGRAAAPPAASNPSWPRLLLVGGLVGGLSGLVGAGGGFLVVPALALLGGLALPEAIGTSLLVIAMQATSGFAVHALQGERPPSALLLIGAGAVLGSLRPPDPEA